MFWISSIILSPSSSGTVPYFIRVSEASVKYEAPTGEFKLFKIKYGTVPEELGDRIIELIQNIKQESFFSQQKETNK